MKKILILPAVALILVVVFAYRSDIKKRFLIHELKELGAKHMMKVDVPQIDSHMYIALPDTLDDEISRALMMHVRESMCDTCFMLSITEVMDWTEVGEDALEQMVDRGKKGVSLRGARN